MTKRPSRKVMNFRHLLRCDTITTDLADELFISATSYDIEAAQIANREKKAGIIVMHLVT